ncbi:MAG: SRPBCC domain-containing protein [Bacteroidetes bacterium]|nr:SRPBCC domain-containing protein [Bacteroidota bacterium]
MTEKILVSATVNANVNKAWDSYTNPAHIVNWNFADPSWQCPWATNDLQPGGKYVARMEAKDGSFGFEFEAVYDEVLPETRLAYTMTDGRKAIVEFTANGSQTDVKVWFDPEQMNPVELQQGGWQAILNSFKHYTEGL